MYCYISFFFGLSYYGYTFNLPEFLCSLLDIAPTLRNFLCPIYDLIVLFKTSRLGEGRERKGGCFRCVYMCSYMSVCAYIYMFYSSHKKMQLHLLYLVSIQSMQIFFWKHFISFSLFFFLKVIFWQIWCKKIFFSYLANILCAQL